jgi:hypothetical protein
MQEEELQTLKNSEADRVGGVDAQASGPGRAGAEPPRGELPEWLAKELFKIFV